MGRSGPTVGDEALQLAEDYASQLTALERRVEASIIGVLERSLNGILRELRRAYRRYLETDAPTGHDPRGNPIQRSGAAVIRESSARLLSVLDVAEGFMPERVIAEWEQRFRDDLAEAQRLGGALGNDLVNLTNESPGVVQGGANRPAVIAASRTAGAYIRGLSGEFRQQLVGITGEAASRGWGPSRMELEVRRALRGAGQSRGVEQRAALIARSELANAYVGGQIDSARRQRFDYVRWVATQDERTCPFCAARHGQVYAVSRVVAPAHPRCRCALVPVPQRDVEEKDAEIRAQVTDEAYWQQSQEKVWAEYAKSKGISLERAASELQRYQRMPTASEKRRFPGVLNSLPPSLAVLWQGGESA